MEVFMNFKRLLILILAGTLVGSNVCAGSFDWRVAALSSIFGLMSGMILAQNKENKRNIDTFEKSERRLQECARYIKSIVDSEKAIIGLEDEFDDQETQIQVQKECTEKLIGYKKALIYTTDDDAKISQFNRILNNDPIGYSSCITNMAEKYLDQDLLLASVQSARSEESDCQKVSALSFESKKLFYFFMKLNVGDMEQYAYDQALQLDKHKKYAREVLARAKQNARAEKPSFISNTGDVSKKKKEVSSPMKWMPGFGAILMIGIYALGCHAVDAFIKK